MARVQILLLGGFAVRRSNGDAAPLPTRKAEALLAVLACRPGEPQPRDRLTALLWGDRADAQARHSLSQTLTSLRRAFADEAAPLLTAGRETVTLCAEAVEIDVAAFRQLAASEATSELTAALDLYRGPFLEGINSREAAFEEWLTEERQRLHGQAMAVALKLAERQAASGDDAAATASLARALALDPLSEETHRRLIRLHLDRGAYNAAIRHYRQCAELLQRELSTVPEPATTALHAEAVSALAAAPDAAPAVPAVTGNGERAPPARPVAIEVVLSQPAVAVFPFDDLGGEPTEAYFAEGITEDIITALSCWRLFPVIARNSSFAYRARSGEVVQAAQELGARYVLQGSVRRSGSKVRISAQLIDAASGLNLWAQRYDRDLGDIFAVQDDIAARIVESIEPQLSRAEQQRALRKPPENLDSWDYTLRALSQLRGFDRAATAEARRLLARAIELDPTSCYAHSLLALAHFHDALAHWTKDPPRVLAATLEAARSAVALSDVDWLSHALLGIALLWTDRQYELAREEVERAIALNPSAVIAHQFLGCVHAFAGSPADAIAPLQTVLRLDPRYQTPALILADLSLSHLLLGDLDSALSFARKAVERERRNVRAHQRLVSCLGHCGPLDEARAALDTLRRLQPDFSPAYVEATYPFRLPEHREVFVDGLRRAGWRDGAAIELVRRA
jgi:TolB-like protein/DNA-binding SARP family transcriptional activator